MRALITVTPIIALVLSIAACQGDAGPAGEQGPPGPQGPAGAPALVDEATAASLIEQGFVAKVLVVAKVGVLSQKSGYRAM